MTHRWILSLWCLCASLGPATASTRADLFQDEVAAIFQRRCLSCHSGDQPKGDFSLQTAEAAFADGYITPGNAAASHLLELITPTAGKARMPKDADPLSPEDVDIIRQWIDDGARWPAGVTLEEPRINDFDWWSYQPLKRPPVPAAGGDWARTPIDRFIVETHSRHGLTAAPPADRRTLIRRVTYDLIGLPPTPEEVAAFENDTDPTAYETLVDRLLASSHYGERWARHWLDVVKYADTCGYDKDKLRPNAWPYRDYVTRAFNDDKPYSRFVQEQIAGDALFPGEPDGILALGFIAAGPWDFIGHVEVAESKFDGQVARNLDRDDMVSNTLNTFCSVTVQCARCHNHKFDPMTQEHYYGLQSLFAAVDRADRPYDLDPAIERQRQELAAEAQQRQAELAALNRELAADGGPLLADLNRRIKEWQPLVGLMKEPQYGYHSQIATAPEAVKWVEVDLGQTLPATTVILHPCHDEYAGIGAGFGFPVRYRVDVAGATDDWQTIADHTMADIPNPGIEPVEIGPVNREIRRVRVTATRLMTRSNDFNFALAELEVQGSDGRNLAAGAAVRASDSIEALPRWSRDHLTDGRWPAPTDHELAARLRDATRERDALLATIETPERVARRAALQTAIESTQQTLSSLPQGKLVYAAATSFSPRGQFKPTEGTLRPIHVLHRGNILQRGAPATPGLLPLAAGADWRIDADLDESQRRAALALWLTDPEHPLVWRSIVNRVWQYHFGQGLVDTPNDFGRMGSLPTHPDLLDWLAVEFRDDGQSLKRLHRLIVTSSVYRQSAEDNPDNAAIDGSNQFLWRANRRRLTAEEIRDSILAVSGVLNPQMEGPGFYLFELEKPEHSPHFEYHKFDPADATTHRRSIYRFVVRSQPDPWMTTLDCADSSQSTPRRTETLTALQALSLLNNRFNLVMAERFADRLAADTRTDAPADADDMHARVSRAVQLVAQRPVSAGEQQELLAYAQSHGLKNLCRLLFNLSEFVFVE